MYHTMLAQPTKLNDFLPPSIIFLCYAVRSRPGRTLWFGPVHKEHGFALANSINYVVRFSTVNVTYNYCYRYFEGLVEL